MRVIRTIAMREEFDTPIETRYGFSNKVEAMMASGVVGSLLERVLTEENPTFTPAFKNEIITREAALALHTSVQLRHMGFNVPAAMDGRDRFLTNDESIDLWNAVDWASGHMSKETALDSKDGFPAVVASGIQLKKAILDIEHPSYMAASFLLQEKEHRGLRLPTLRRQPNLGAAIEKYSFFPDPDRVGGFKVQVIADSELKDN